MNLTRLLFILASLSFLTACSKDGDDSKRDPAFRPGDTQERQFTSSIDERGIATFDFAIDGSSTGAQFIVFGGAARGRIAGFSGPGIVSNDFLRNPAFEGNDRSEFQTFPIAVNLPPPDANLSPGAYRLAIQLAPPPTSGLQPAPIPAALSGVLVTKRDSDLAIGTVPINMVYVGPVGNAEEARGAIGAALKVAQIIMDRAFLTLDIEEYEFEGPDQLPDPSIGDPLYEEISNSTRPGVNIVLGVDFRTGNSQTQGTQFTRMGGVPVPVIPSSKSAAAISIFDVTGGDGTFNATGPGQSARHDDEVRLMAEEITQAIGHYLGLRHIVELTANKVTRTDDIADSPACIALPDCTNEVVVRSNFMFPFPVREIRFIRPGTSPSNFGQQQNQGAQFYPRDRVTIGQAAVMQRSVLVN